MVLLLTHNSGCRSPLVEWLAQRCACWEPYRTHCLTRCDAIDNLSMSCDLSFRVQRRPEATHIRTATGTCNSTILDVHDEGGIFHDTEIFLLKEEAEAVLKDLHEK